jgi:hypothetical protein
MTQPRFQFFFQLCGDYEGQSTPHCNFMIFKFYRLKDQPLYSDKAELAYNKMGPDGECGLALGDRATEAIIIWWE